MLKLDDSFWVCLSEAIGVAATIWCYCDYGDSSLINGNSLSFAVNIGIFVVRMKMIPVDVLKEFRKWGALTAPVSPKRWWARVVGRFSHLKEAKPSLLRGSFSRNSLTPEKMLTCSRTLRFTHELYRNFPSVYPHRHPLSHRSTQERNRLREGEMSERRRRRDRTVSPPWRGC